MKLNIQSVGILAGAVAVVYLLLAASKAQKMQQGYISVNTDGQPYLKTLQNDAVISSEVELTWT